MSALILTGSPKGRKSASFTLASKLAEGLLENNLSVSHEQVHASLRTEEGTRRLLELVAERRTRVDSPGFPRLAVIVQCGFPESHQCDTAVGICRLFAERTGMRWAGALAMGMGGTIGEDIGKMPGGGKNILDALKMTAESLSKGGVIPIEATTLFAKPLMPRWLYTMMGNLGWRMQLRKNKARRPLTHRPYSQE